MPKRTEAERRELRRKIRYLHEHGASNRAIARSLGLGEHAVREYLAAPVDGRADNVVTLPLRRTA